MLSSEDPEHQEGKGSTKAPRETLRDVHKALDKEYSRLRRIGTMEMLVQSDSLGNIARRISTLPVLDGNDKVRIHGWNTLFVCGYNFRGEHG